jgi:hypothetical protein
MFNGSYRHSLSFYCDLLVSLVEYPNTVTPVESTLTQRLMQLSLIYCDLCKMMPVIQVQLQLWHHDTEKNKKQHIGSKKICTWLRLADVFDLQNDF